MNLTLEQKAELRILSLMSEDTKKFALEIGYHFHDESNQLLNQRLLAEAFERLQLRDWIRLIDISPIAAAPDRLFRIYRVMPEAVKWYEEAPLHPFIFDVEHPFAGAGSGWPRRSK